MEDTKRTRPSKSPEQSSYVQAQGRHRFELSPLNTYYSFQLGIFIELLGKWTSESLILAPSLASLFLLLVFPHSTSMWCFMFLFCLKKLHSIANGEHYRKPQLNTIQTPKGCGKPSLSRDICNTFPTSMAQGTLRKRG